MTEPRLQRPELFERRCLVGGEWVGGERTMAVDNPATGAILAEIPRLGRAEMRRAIVAAQAAMPGWVARTARDRAALAAGCPMESQRAPPRSPPSRCADCARSAQTARIFTGIAVIRGMALMVSTLR